CLSPFSSTMVNTPLPSSLSAAARASFNSPILTSTVLMYTPSSLPSKGSGPFTAHLLPCVRRLLPNWHPSAAPTASHHTDAYACAPSLKYDAPTTRRKSRQCAF